MQTGRMQRLHAHAQSWGDKMENSAIFQERLSDLLEEAEASDGVLTQGQIRDCLKDLPLQESHYQLIYEYLAEQNVRVLKSGQGSGSGTAQTDSGGEEKRPSLSMYLEELSEFEDVDEETEICLFAKARAGDPEAENRLVELYLPLVCRIAEEYGEEVLPAEDLIQEGNLGLLFAVQSLQPYETLAACRADLTNRIREAMDEAVHSVEEQQKKDDSVVSRINHLNEAIHNLEQELGRKVSAEELSAYLEMPLEEIEDLLRVAGDQMSRQ